jgi:nucleoside-diphosphate-sugar epimerase
VSRVFITGATGCIGQYVVEALLRETQHELVLAVRDPARLALPLDGRERVQVVLGDLRETDCWDAAARDADSAILIATSWTAGYEAHAVNVDATTALLTQLDPARCRRVIYFSTASILDADGQLLAEAETVGTPYIQSKYRMRRALDAREDLPSLVVLYPTLVLGGDAAHALSHVSRTLVEAVRHRRWLRWFAGDASFHFVHAADIAQIVCALLAEPAITKTPHEYILGNAPVTLDESIDALLTHSGSMRTARISLSPWLTSALIALFRIRLAPWDRYCLQRRHFTYRHAVGAAAFGRTPLFPTLGAALDATLPRRLFGGHSPSAPSTRDARHSTP